MHKLLSKLMTNPRPQHARNSLRNSHPYASPRKSFDRFGTGKQHLCSFGIFRFFWLPWISISSKKSPRVRRRFFVDVKLGIAFFSALSVFLVVRGNIMLRLHFGYSCQPSYGCDGPKLQRERVIHYEFNVEEGFYRVGIDTQYDKSQQRRSVPALGNLENQKRLRRADYVEGVDRVETNDCKLRYEWQKSFRPTCNNLHEFDMTTPWTPATNGGFHKRYRIIGFGYWRDVWIVNYDLEKVVFKSMRYDHDFTLRNFDRMRRDAAVMDRMTHSKNIIDLYGFCGTSSLSEYGDGGDVITPLENGPTMIERLQIGRPIQHTSAHFTILTYRFAAVQVSTALADLHNSDKEGEPSIAHTDISPGQFIKVGDRFKLNDFNRARFLAWSHSKQKPCTYHVANNAGKFRSPEEYLLKPQTEMDEWPFGDIVAKEAQEKVKNGHRPSIYADIWNSTDPVNRFLLEAMVHCHEQEPENRWTARQVEQYLSKGLKTITAG